MIKTLFICRLHELELSERISGFDKINDNLSVTNDKNYIKSLIKESAKSIIGAMEYDDLLSGHLVAFSSEEIPETTETKPYLIEKLYQLQSFVLSTWINMDNAINFETGFLFAAKPTGTVTESNLLTCKFSDSRGKSSTIEISRSKLAEMRKFYREKMKFDNSKSSTKISNEYKRVDRALYMISSARSESDLGLKVANYCTVLEALLSTSQNELAHQVAERLAFFIGETPDAKIETYRLAKKAYSIRSKVVHGDAIGMNDIQNLGNISEFCDSSIRKLFSMLLSTPRLYSIVNDGKMLDEFIIELIMGKRSFHELE